MAVIGPYTVPGTVGLSLTEDTTAQSYTLTCPHGGNAVLTLAYVSSSSISDELYAAYLFQWLQQAGAGFSAQFQCNCCHWLYTQGG